MRATYIVYDAFYGMKRFVIERRYSRLGQWCEALEIRTQKHSHSVNKLETAGAGVVSCGCNKYPKKADTVREPAKDQKKWMVKDIEKTKLTVLYSADDNNTTELTGKTHVKTIDKGPKEPYRDVLAFPDTGEISVFKNWNDQVYVFF